MVDERVNRRVVSPSLIGRSADLDLLISAVTAPPAVVTVRGEAGIGKTRLVTELAGRPEMDGRHWVVGTCRPIREPFPLGPLIEAIGSLGEGVASTAFSPVVGSLRPLLPEIADSLPRQPPPLDDRAGERHRIFRGMVEVFSSLGRAVLVLEDVHWADAQTPEFISYLLAEPPSQLSVVLTFREAEVPAAIVASTAKLPASVYRADLTLEPLNETQTGALTATILGQQQISAEFAAYICERTSGVPFAVEELLALLQARGALKRGRVGWVRRTLDELAVPVGIRTQVMERVGVLSDDARAVVDAAAVLQAPVPMPVLRATCRGSGNQTHRGLEEALHEGVLVTQGNLVGFRHVLAARAVYDHIPGPTRQDLHSRAVTALEALDPVPIGQLAHHLRHAGRTDEWAAAAERAADQATGLGHDDEAARLLEDVLRNAPLDAVRQGNLAIKLASAAIETLNITEGMTSLLSEVLDKGLPTTLRGELRFRLALLHEAAGADPLRVRQLYVEAVDDLDDSPDLQAWAMMGLGIHATPGVPLAEHRRWVQRVLEILPHAGPPAFQAFLLGKVAMVLVVIGDPSWRQLVHRLEEQTEGTPRHRREVNAYQSVGMAACYAGHYQDADRLLTRAMDSVVTRENRKLELRVVSARALLDFCAGRWDTLSDTVPVLLDELADYPLARVDVEAVAGSLSLAHGNVDSARQRLAEVAREAAGLGSLELAAIAVSSLARLEAASNEPGAALEHVRGFLSAADAKDFWMPVVRALPGITQALVATGHEAKAQALLRSCGGALDRLDAPLATATVPHAHGWLNAATQRWLEAAGNFRAAAERYNVLSCSYEAAQAREQAANCLLNAGDHTAADALTSALATYQQLGASWDRDRAAHTARQHGISVPTLHRGGRHGYQDELSPREREVAALAATGRTNKEIASKLFLSPKTVEKHVSAALRKLGLRSRSALAGHFSDMGSEPRSESNIGGIPY